MNGPAAPRHWVIIPAAGRGTRMGRERPKQYLPLAGEAVLAHALRCFVGHPAVSGVVVALAADDRHWHELDATLRGAVTTVEGGRERADSVRHGLDALSGRGEADDWVLVHDAARPCLRRADLDRLLETLAGDRVGGLLAVPVRDTIKRCGADGRIAATVSRDELWHAQTPQMFRLGLLRDALAAHPDVTDEAMAVERAGHAARLVEGHADNLKITRPEDLTLAAWYLGHEGTTRCG